EPVAGAAAARLPLRDQPAVRPGLPVPPDLLGIRPRRGDRARQPARQLAGGTPHRPLPPVGGRRRGPRPRAPRPAARPSDPDPRSL
ncbi:MAG: Membrane protein insertion efficiency factor YidD, partial [uncultured Nocardioidaceae bacterium]